jgi:hypothetical protein
MGIADRWSALPRWRRAGFLLATVFLGIPYCIAVIYPPFRPAFFSYFLSIPMLVGLIAFGIFAVLWFFQRNP